MDLHSDQHPDSDPRLEPLHLYSDPDPEPVAACEQPRLRLGAELHVARKLQGQSMTTNAHHIRRLLDKRRQHTVQHTQGMAAVSKQRT